MISEGVTKLANQQIADGGWGWFSGFGEQSYPHTTAVVIHGLQVARDSDVQLPPGMLERGVEWLKGYQARQISLIKNHPNNLHATCMGCAGSTVLTGEDRERVIGPR